MSNRTDDEGGFDLAKLVFFLALAGIVIGGAFGVGLYSAHKKNVVYRQVLAAWKDVKLVVREKEALTGGEPIHYLQPARHEGSGVTINKRGDDEKLILVAGFFDGGNAIRLLRRDGSVLREWRANFSDHFPDKSHLPTPPATDLNVDLHGALVNPDGSVVFNYEYSGAVKLDRCGAVEWTLRRPTHHSMEPAVGGGYWISDRRFLEGDDRKQFPPFDRLSIKSPIKDDLILRVDEDGSVLIEKSVAEILYANGYAHLLTATGEDMVNGAPWDFELVHLNKVGELSPALAPAFPQFVAGDLVLSVRQYNLVFVVDPKEWKIKWLQSGPWLRQHDPEFEPDGTIAIYNNNTFRTDQVSAEILQARPDLPLASNIVRIDPSTRRLDKIYGERPGQGFLSIVRGKHDPTPEGGRLITEFQAGRVFEIDRSGDIVWEYINRYDADRVLEVTEGRIYAPGYFNVADWTCNGRG